jgi:hypothetical protein
MGSAVRGPTPTHHPEDDRQYRGATSQKSDTEIRPSTNAATAIPFDRGITCSGWNRGGRFGPCSDWSMAAPLGNRHESHEAGATSDGL